MGKGVRNSGVRVNSVVGGNIGDGSNSVGCLQPLRTALHTISISLQNSLN